MKIAYFIGTFKKEDGVAQVLLAIIREARKKGIESVIVTGWAEDVSVSPVPVIQVPSIIFPLYKEYRLPLPGMGGFEGRLNEFQPDIIHIHSPDTIAFAALKYAKKYNLPVFATHHTDFARYLSYYRISFLKPLLWFILRRLYARINIVTVPSPVTANDLTSHGIKNVAVIQWGVDFTRFNPSFRSEAWREKIAGSKEKNILLCVCRLTWEKDLRTLAAIFHLLKKNRSDFVMVIAGDGPISKELKLLMPEAVFLGHIEGYELSQAYASSDILLFPSSTETFGNVTIEAMASGIIPIVADAGGSKSLVKNGETGFLAEPKNPDDFYKKTVMLLDDLKLREKMKTAGAGFVKNFAWENVFDALLKIYADFPRKTREV